MCAYSYICIYVCTNLPNEICMHFNFLFYPRIFMYTRMNIDTGGSIETIKSKTVS